MTIVLDTSAAVTTILSPALTGSIPDHISTADRVITSELYLVESANVLWKYVRGKVLDRATANETHALLCGLIDEFVPVRQDVVEAMNEAIRLQHPAYDMLYLILARRTGAMLVTLDKTLKKLARQNGIAVNRD